MKKAAGKAMVKYPAIKGKFGTNEACVYIPTQDSAWSPATIGWWYIGKAPKSE